MTATTTTATTCSALDWNTMLGLCERLNNDGRHRDYLLILMGCHVGLRVRDLLSLRWCDVLDADEIRLNESKTGKQRIIQINPRVRNAIHKCVRHEQAKPYWTVESPLFANRRGDAISVNYINKRLKWVLFRYQVKTDKASSHLLRKTFGLRVWQLNGESEKALVFLSEIFGHTSTAVTRRYLGITQAQIADVYMQL